MNVVSNVLDKVINCKVWSFTVHFVRKNGHHWRHRTNSGRFSCIHIHGNVSFFSFFLFELVWLERETRNFFNGWKMWGKWALLVDCEPMEKRKTCREIIIIWHSLSNSSWLTMLTVLNEWTWIKIYLPALSAMIIIIFFTFLTK